MNAVDYILAGLEAELALERELGVRLVECDRSLLVPVSAPAPTVAPTPTVAPAKAVALSTAFDFVFLHDRSLTAGELEMMSKIVAALGKTNATAPVAYEGVLPKAKAYVVLGKLALKKWFPGVNAAPGAWVATSASPNVLVTYSPGYILRFAQVTPALQKIKKDMWNSIKSVLQRIRSS